MCYVWLSRLLKRAYANVPYGVGPLAFLAHRGNMLPGAVTVHCQDVAAIVPGPLRRSLLRSGLGFMPRLKEGPARPAWNGGCSKVSRAGPGPFSLADVSRRCQPRVFTLSGGAPPRPLDRVRRGASPGRIGSPLWLLERKGGALSAQTRSARRTRLQETVPIS